MRKVLKLVIYFALCCSGCVQGQVKQEICRQQLLDCIAGEWIARSVYTAVKLDIATHLHEGPKTTEELATLTHTQEEPLYRVLRLLASVGIFQELDSKQFANTDSSLLLSTRHPDSLHGLATFYGEEIHASFDALMQKLKTGKSAFEYVYGKPPFTYFKENPERGLLFNRAMQEKSKSVANAVLNAYDFSSYSTVCDIGGGYGHFLTSIIGRYPHIKGILYDLKEVIQIVESKNPALKSFNCKSVEGDFFQAVPTGGDVYLLKSILHDWNDEQALLILKQCYQAMQPGSRLLLVESMLLPANEMDYAKCMDILMLAVTGGKERTVQVFESLLQKAGFQELKLYPTSTEFYILEACKK